MKIDLTLCRQVTSRGGVMDEGVGGNARWRSRRWRIRSSNRPWSPSHGRFWRDASLVKFAAPLSALKPSTLGKRRERP